MKRISIVFSTLLIVILLLGTNNMNAVETSKGVVDIAVGGYHGMVLWSDGTVSVWGQGLYGALGLASSSNNYVVTENPNISNVISIAAGTKSSFAILNDGTVWAWGENGNDALGVPTVVSKAYSPVQVPNLTNIIKVVAGADGGLALKDDGTVWSWGKNSYGEAGQGHQNPVTTPTQITSLSNIVDINMSSYNCAAKTDDGTFYVWGWNSKTEVMDGLTDTYVKSPVEYTAVSDIKDIQFGYQSSFVLKNDGTVWASGNTSYMPTRSETTMYLSQISGLTDVQEIFIGYYEAFYKTSDGSIYATSGSNSNATIGMSGTPVKTPSLISALFGADRVDSSQILSLAKMPDATIKIVGAASFNTYGSATTSFQVLAALNPQNLPEAPSNLSTSNITDSVTLTWDEGVNADTYNIKRSLASGGPYTLIASDVLSTTFTDDTVSAGTYYYVVSSSNNGFESTNSSEIEVTPIIAPTMPQNLEALAGDGSVSLDWDDFSEPGTYSVYRSIETGTNYELVAADLGTSEYVDVAVENDTTYYYVVTVTVEAVESSYSIEVTTTPIKVVEPRSLFVYELENGNIRMSDLSEENGDLFEYWLEQRLLGQGLDYYLIEKSIEEPLPNYVNVGNVTGRSEYVIFDKLNSVEVIDYDVE